VLVKAIRMFLFVLACGLVHCQGGDSSEPKDSGADYGTDLASWDKAQPDKPADGFGPPLPPTEVKTNLTYATGTIIVSVSWKPSEGAFGYYVYRSSVSGGPYTRLPGYKRAGGLQDLNSTSDFFEDGVKQEDLPLFYVVRAVNEYGESEASNEASAGLPLPPAPMHLRRACGDGKAMIAWGDVQGATGFVVLRSETGGEPYQQVAEPMETVLTDTGLKNATTYTYVVRARNASGQSGDSDPVSVTPLAGVAAPAAPTGLAADPRDGYVRLTWSEVQFGCSDGSGLYRVGRGTTSGGPYSPTVGNGLAMGATWTDYPGINTTRYYAVQGVNAEGSSAWSGEARLPAAPTGVAATVIGLQVQLTWNPSIDFTGYQVYKHPSSENSWKPVGSVVLPPFLDSDVIPGGEYHYSVQGTGPGGASLYTHEVKAKM
jgi:hypothetical protein